MNRRRPAIIHTQFIMIPYSKRYRNRRGVSEKMKGQIMYSIVVPVHNKEEIIQVMYSRLTKVMEQTGQAYELIFVNDGSRDHTMDILTQAALIDSSVRVIDFSRNFGQQIALTAGMDAAAGQAIIIMNADLKDPPELIFDMIELWNQGYDVVWAKRKACRAEPRMKRVTAAVYNRILRGLAKEDIPVDSGDFRLIDRKVNEAMTLFQEKNRTLRELVRWVGFRQTHLEYDPVDQARGQNKDPLRKMLQLSADRASFFSDKPLKMAAYAGIIISCISCSCLLVTLCLLLFTDNKAAGWASLVFIILLLNGITLIILGTMGAYIRRIYDESKGRPLYIVREKIGFDQQVSTKEEKEDHPPELKNYRLSEALSSLRDDMSSYHS